jgi:membrane protein DedA with SNARE-associated domain
MSFFEHILVPLGEFVVSVIEATGEVGVFVLMALESANIPIPSEIIMPFAGFVASRGELLFWFAVLAGALGNTIGSVVSYWIGIRGGRPFLERWGRYIFIHARDLERGDRAFQKYGVKIAFWSRLLPVVRTFVSLPAGINRAPFAPFVVFTFIGSLIWSCLLTDNPFFLRTSVAIVILIVLIIAGYVWYHIKNGKSQASHRS